MNADQAAQLRTEFPPGTVGKLPRKTKDGKQFYLDYVGHAAVTDRLLQVDPDWTWEPAGLDDVGLPAFDPRGGLWIKLTVCGVTRLGYGHGGTGFEPGDDVKKAIGDALRNAAMRFGVALDLWAKEDLKDSSPPNDKFQGTPTKPSSGDPHPQQASAVPPSSSGSAEGQSPEPSGGEAHSGAIRTSTSPETVQESGLNQPINGEVSTTPINGEVANTPAPGAVTELGAEGAKALAAALGGQKFALDLARDEYGPDVTSLRKLTMAQGAKLLEIKGVSA